ncbi:heme exporter protein CcmB, partial [Staphylococcus pseudintermedius]
MNKPLLALLLGAFALGSAEFGTVGLIPSLGHQLQRSSDELGWLVAVRTFTHWATTSLPLLIAAPVLGELLYLPREQLPVLLLSLALGTPVLSLLGAVVAALTVGMRRSGI